MLQFAKHLLGNSNILNADPLLYPQNNSLDNANQQNKVLSCCRKLPVEQIQLIFKKKILPNRNLRLVFIGAEFFFFSHRALQTSQECKSIDLGTPLCLIRDEPMPYSDESSGAIQFEWQMARIIVTLVSTLQSSQPPQPILMGVGHY